MRYPNYYRNRCNKYDYKIRKLMNGGATDLDMKTPLWQAVGEFMNKPEFKINCQNNSCEKENIQDLLFQMIKNGRKYDAKTNKLLGHDVDRNRADVMALQYCAMCDSKHNVHKIPLTRATVKNTQHETKEELYTKYKPHRDICAHGCLCKLCMKTINFDHLKSISKRAEEIELSKRGQKVVIPGSKSVKEMAAKFGK